MDHGHWRQGNRLKSSAFGGDIRRRVNYDLRILETLQITLFFGSTYVVLIQNFGNFDKLFVINWMDSSTEAYFYYDGPTHRWTFVVQLYFGYCLFALDRKNAFMTIVIVITSAQSGSALACDIIIITVSLVYAFNQRRSELKRTNFTLLQTLTTNAINRGALTASISAALNFILFLSRPGTFYFLIGLMPSSKLSVNSMLATLNTRQHIRSTAASVADSTARFNSFPIRSLSRGPNLSNSPLQGKENLSMN
ncbi:hypothetical protein BDZ97DRAFT_2057490 [Flammula alnicola]|nr:hypothetical protein BDZ97DRAFT_2057490 [Flammula alnicola]